MEKEIENENQEVKRKVNKKVIIISIISFIVIAAIASVLIFIQNDNSYKIEEITKFSYFRLYENEKYGVIDDKGNTIIEAKYEMVTIPNPSKPVFICYFDYNSEKDEYKTEVLNENNEKILTKYSEVLPLMFKDAYSKVPYEKSILKYKENDKYGIIDFEGNKITNAIYDEIESILYREGCLLVKKDDKYGVINMKGKKIIDISYDSISVDGYYDEETKYQNAGFIVGIKKQEGYRYGYINNNGNILLKEEYNEISRITEINHKDGIYLIAFKNGQAGVYNNKKQIISSSYKKIEYNESSKVFIVEKNLKSGVFDKKGNKILPTDYENIIVSGENINAQKDGTNYQFDINGNKIETQNNNVIYDVKGTQYNITVNEDSQFGITDKKLNVILENEYSYIEYAFNDYFIIIKDGAARVINIKTKEIVIDNYNFIENVAGKNIIEAIISEPYTIELYSEKMEKVVSMQNATLENKEDYIKLYSTTERKYFDNSGNELQNKDIFDLDLYAFNQEGKWGFKNKEENVIVNPIYDMVTELNSYGFAGIKKDNKWGIIDNTGKVILEPTYEIEWNEPTFIGNYCEYNLGYGMIYYTKEIK